MPTIAFPRFESNRGLMMLVAGTQRNNTADYKRVAEEYVLRGAIGTGPSRATCMEVVAISNAAYVQHVHTWITFRHVGWRCVANALWCRRVSAHMPLRPLCACAQMCSLAEHAMGSQASGFGFAARCFQWDTDRVRCPTYLLG